MNLPNLNVEIWLSILESIVGQVDCKPGSPPSLPVYEPVYWPGPPPVELGPPPTFPPIEHEHTAIHIVGVPGVHYLVP
jgi:hypothetical protein